MGQKMAAFLKKKDVIIVFFTWTTLFLHQIYPIHLHKTFFIYIYLYNTLLLCFRLGLNGFYLDLLGLNAFYLACKPRNSILVIQT
jgi:hypothetical protein